MILSVTLPFMASAIYLAVTHDYAPSQALDGVQEGSVDSYWSIFYLISTAFSGTGLR